MTARRRRFSPVGVVRIKGRDWRVFVVKGLKDSDGDTCCGLSDLGTYTISVAANDHQTQRDTLFHEVVHAACPTLSEDDVMVIETDLYAALTENPALREYLWPTPALAKPTED